MSNTLPTALDELGREGADVDLLQRRAMNPILDNARHALDSFAKR
jgi:hypothetical protein